MTLLLSNEEIETILEMKSCLAVLEEAYRDLATGKASPGLRSDVVVPSMQPNTVYALKVYATAFPSREVGAIRLNSDLLNWIELGGKKQRRKIPAAHGNRWVGLILLFSTRTGEPLAIFPDGVIQRARVGATSALAMDRLARSNATELAIIGSGWQAGAQVMAACAARDFRRVRVFSPNRDHREEFCTVYERALGVQYQPVESVADAVKGADVVLCATNSMQPVLDVSLLEPGMHVGFIRIPEAGSDVLARADVLFRHISDDLTRFEILERADSPDVRSDRGWDGSGSDKLRWLPDLSDLIGGQIPGRTGPNQISCFLNNVGIGLQFAAVGHAMFEAARERGIGRELPTEWFTESVHP